MQGLRRRLSGGGPGIEQDVRLIRPRLRKADRRARAVLERDAINEAAMASEFRTLLRMELDIEEALRTTLQEHHNADYRGDYEVLVHLVQLADFIYPHMAELPAACEFPGHNLSVLQVSPERVIEAATKVLDSRDEIVSLSKLLAHSS